MNLVFRFLILSSTLILMSCSTLSPIATSPFKNRDRDYLTAKTIPPLIIPPGLSSEDFQTYYPVSNRQYPKQTEDVSLMPPGLMDKSN